MDKITVKIEGMMCGMCEAHICDAVRRVLPEAKKVRASRRRGEATFLTGGAVDDNMLTNAISDTGYKVTAVLFEPYEKPRLFKKR